MTVLTFPPQKAKLTPETEAVYLLVMQLLDFNEQQQDLFLTLATMAIANERQARASKGGA
jgi:hypothetical protein